MTSLERAARPAAWAEPPAAVRFFLDAWTVAEAEPQKLAHDPTELLSRAVQPILATGVLHKYLVSPASRLSLVTGKAVAGGLRALVQAAVVYVVAARIGVRVQLGVLMLVGVAVVVVLGAAGFATFSPTIARLAM